MAGSQQLAATPQRTKRPPLKYQPASLEHFLRFFAPDDGIRIAEAAYRNIKLRDRFDIPINKGKHSYAASLLSNIAYEAHFANQDVYMSPQAFNEWRCVGDLRRISAWYVDIDTEGHRCGYDADEIEAQVLRAVRRADLPAPHAIVRTGSGGCHLYWFTSLEITRDNKRQAVKGWKSVAHWLTDSINAHKPKSAKWKADASASHDPVRLLRLPGSMHSCGVKATASVIADRSAWGRYSFWDFVALAPKHQSTPIQQHLFAADVPTVHNNARKDSETGKPKPKSTRHTYGSWQSRLYWHLVRYARTEGVKESQRDILLHIALSALLQLNPGDPDKAYAEIRQLNRDHVGLPDREFEQYMQTTLRQRYTYGMDTANRKLQAVGIPPLQSNARRSTLTPEQVKERQQQGAQIAAANKRNATTEALIDLLTTRATITQREAAEALGKSLRTVKTYWREALAAVQPPQSTPEQEGAISSPSIYPPQGESIEKDFPNRPDQQHDLGDYPVNPLFERLDVSPDLIERQGLLAL